MSRSGVPRTVGVALGVSLVCSGLVSATVISLRAVQEENRSLSRMKMIVRDLKLGREAEGFDETLRRIRPFLVNIEAGTPLPEDQYLGMLNPERFDVAVMANHPEYSTPLPRDRDMAGIGRMPRYMLAYRVLEHNAVQSYLFSIFGKGLYSTLYGVIALEEDLSTVAGITFYEHGETPGLGGEVDNARWKNQWRGKQAFDDEGDVRIRVIPGEVDPASPQARHQIDGLTGATFTTRGVDQLVRFWLGDDGYGPFIRKLREQGREEAGDSDVEAAQDTLRSDLQ